MAGSIPVRLRPAESVWSGLCQGISYSLRRPRLMVIRRLTFQSSPMYMPKKSLTVIGAGPPIICDESSRAPSRNVANGSPDFVRSGLLNVLVVNDWLNRKLSVFDTYVGPALLRNSKPAFM